MVDYINRIMRLMRLSINATGSQRGLSSQPRFIEVANSREQPSSGIKRLEAQHQPSASLRTYQQPKLAKEPNYPD